MPIQKGPANLGTGTIDAAELASGSVTTAKIADAAITTAKIADGAVVTADIAANAITPAKMANSGAELGMRNRIINGAMVIDQRNAGASVTNIVGGVYTLDRYEIRGTQASKCTVQQSSTAATGFVNSALVTSSSAYSVVVGDYFVLSQLVEGTNIADFGWGTASAATVTLSFWVRSSLTGTFGGSLRNSAGNRSYPFSYTISAANTWEQKSITIAGDTSGTWLTTTGIGIRIGFGLGVGSTYSGAAGAWSAANYISATGATSVVGTNGATFYITGVQLEVGSTATAFDYKPFGTELQLCQRYYEQYNFVGRTSMYGAAQSTSTAECLFRYMVTKRASPTISVNSYLSYRVNDWKGGDQQAASFTVNESDPIQARFQFTKATANLNTGFVIYMNKEGGQPDPLLYISAEL